MIATAFITISIGTARHPHTFQTQPQNRSPTKIATAFMRAARLVSHGVSRNPSRLVMSSATAPTVTAMRMLPNCRNAITDVAPVTITGPKYGIELKMPASTPHTAACSTPSARNDSQVARPTTTLVKTWTIRNISICRSIS